MAEEQGPAWRQTVFYPFAEAAHTLSVDLSGLPQADAADMRITHAMMLHDDNPHRQNTAEQPDAVVPVPLDANAADGRVSFALPPISWAAVRFSAAPDSL